MSIDNRLFDDLTRVAGGAASILSAVGKQLGDGLKDQMGQKFSAAPFSSSSSSSSAANDDLDRLHGVVSKLRMEQEDLKKRVEFLESLVGGAAKKTTRPPLKKASAAKKTPVKKTSTKKPAKKKLAEKRA